MNILNFFKKEEKKEKDLAIEEIPSSVKKKIENLSEHEKSFLGKPLAAEPFNNYSPRTSNHSTSSTIVTPGPFYTSSSGEKGATGAPGTSGTLGINGASGQNGSSGFSGRTRSAIKIPVKINILPAIQDPKLKFIGYSKMDGYPCYFFLGSDPKWLTQYPYEELHTM